MTSTKVASFKNQDYKSLRRNHQDLGVPWTDPVFPPSDSSIGFSKLKDLPRNIQWKRPHELSPRPRLFVDGVSFKDATQGRLGNCWFVAAASVLASSRSTWERVLPEPEDQEWSDQEMGKYSGIFRFRFWRFGAWMEVLVDDLLPVTHDGHLLFAHSAAADEFWMALLEKAYAKLHGCYGALDGGNLSDALVDFTSGVSEVVDLMEIRSVLRSDEEKKKALFHTLIEEIEDHALLCCAIRPGTPDENLQRTELGLIKGHAYGITAVKKVPIGEVGLKSLFRGREKLWLLRLQNPWGKGEWTGPMSDASPEWSKITQKEKESLGLVNKDDGEFWVPYDDFLANFTELSICRLINTSLFSFKKTWIETQFFDSWTIGAGILDRSGGCANSPKTFLNNHQYRFDVISTSDDSKKEEEKRTEIIVQLSQRDTRVSMEESKGHLVIGFQILRVESNRTFRVHSMDDDTESSTSDYIRTKHIFMRFFPKQIGRYIIVPTTFKPGETTDFMLRIFTESSSVRHVKRLDEEVPELTFWRKMMCMKKPVLVTKIKVLEANGLEKIDKFGSLDVYCIVKCEGQTVKSTTSSKTSSPKWTGFTVIFYRKKMDRPIKLQLWNKNLVVDTFMGQVFVDAPLPVGGSSQIVKEKKELFGKGNESQTVMPGTILFEYQTTTNMAEL